MFWAIRFQGSRQEVSVPAIVRSFATVLREGNSLVFLALPICYVFIRVSVVTQESVHAGFSPLSCSCGRRVHRVVFPDRPGHARHLVGQGHDRLVAGILALQ